MTGINILKLKGKMVENAVSMDQMADALGINTATMYRKLNNNGKTLLVCEANQIVKLLRLTKEEALAIFFSEIVA